MAKFNVLLLGIWHCGPHETLSFEVTHDNTLHEHYSNGHEDSDSYYFYLDGTGTYLMTTANNKGFFGHMISSDGSHFSGEILAGPILEYPAKMKFAVSADGKLHVHSEMTENGVHASDTSCDHSIQ